MLIVYVIYPVRTYGKNRAFEALSLTFIDTDWKTEPRVTSPGISVLHDSNTLLILCVLLAALWHWSLPCLVYGPTSIITDPETLSYVPKCSLKFQTLCHGL